jgi:hypothetical protein
MVCRICITSRRCSMNTRCVPQLCYCGVTVVLLWCHSGVTVVSQWLYSCVTGMLISVTVVLYGIPDLHHQQKMFDEHKVRAKVVLLCCYSGVRMVLHWCNSGVTVVLRWCYNAEDI